MENKWKKGIEDFKKVRLSEENKTLIMKRILNRPLYGFIKSPFIFIQKQAVYFSASFLIMMVGTMVFASENSLPGNTFYPVKIGIVEPVKGIVKFSPEKRLEWLAKKATRRLDEVEILAAKNMLDENRKAYIEDLFNKQAREFNDFVKVLSYSLDKGSSNKVALEFEARVSAHTRVVEKITMQNFNRLSVEKEKENFIESDDNIEKEIEVKNEIIDEVEAVITDQKEVKILEKDNEEEKDLHKEEIILLEEGTIEKEDLNKENKIEEGIIDNEKVFIYNLESLNNEKEKRINEIVEERLKILDKIIEKDTKTELIKNKATSTINKIQSE